jgi:hypothetical protein
MAMQELCMEMQVFEKRCELQNFTLCIYLLFTHLRTTIYLTLSGVLSI